MKHLKINRNIVICITFIKISCSNCINNDFFLLTYKQKYITKKKKMYEQINV